jgi:hypothetical protein
LEGSTPEPVVEDPVDDEEGSRVNAPGAPV